MVQINNILVIVDPTAREHPAITKATQIAAKCSARIELFACETKESREARFAAHLARGDGSEFVADLRALLKPLAEHVREQGLDVCVETDSGEPLHAKLIDRTQRTSADLVVKDTHHHSLAKRTFLTNTDWQLMRGCPVPLLLTKSAPWRAQPIIAAAVDPGHVNDKPEQLDRHILDWSQYLSKRLGGALHVLHAFIPLMVEVQSPSGGPATMALLTSQMIEQLRGTALSELEDLVRTYEVSREDIHLQMGVASEVVPQIADDIHADVVTMGAISRSGLQRLFIGSTAERVLEQIPCDVLVIKPPDFAAVLPF